MKVDYTSYEHKICNSFFKDEEEMERYIFEWQEKSNKDLGLELQKSSESFLLLDAILIHIVTLYNPNLDPRAIAEKELDDYLKLGDKK